MSVNKHNPTFEMCYCGMHYVLFLLQKIWPRIFYSTGDMMNLYSSIQGSLVGSFSIFLMYRYGINIMYTAFNIFSIRILIILYKMLIVTGISNETIYSILSYSILINHICNIMSKRQNILTTRTSFFISSASKIENVRKFKLFK